MITLKALLGKVDRLPDVKPKKNQINVENKRNNSKKKSINKNKKKLDERKKPKQTDSNTTTNTHSDDKVIWTDHLHQLHDLNQVNDNWFHLDIK